MSDFIDEYPVLISDPYRKRTDATACPSSGHVRGQLEAGCSALGLRWSIKRRPFIRLGALRVGGSRGKRLDVFSERHRKKLEFYRTALSSLTGLLDETITLKIVFTTVPSSVSLWFFFPRPKEFKAFVGTCIPLLNYFD